MDNRIAQTILIPKSMFTLKQAVRLLQKAGLNTEKVDIKKKYYRFRQVPPDRTKKYYTETINDIYIIYMY